MEFEMLCKIVADVLQVDPREVCAETTLVDDLGADSLDVCRIIMGIEDKFSVAFPKDAVSKLITVNDAVELIKKIKKA